MEWLEVFVSCCSRGLRAQRFHHVFDNMRVEGAWMRVRVLRMRIFGFRVQNQGFRVRSLGFGFWGLGLRIQV